MAVPARTDQASEMLASLRPRTAGGNVTSLHGSSPERRAARLMALAETVRIADAGAILHDLHDLAELPADIGPAAAQVES